MITFSFQPRGRVPFHVRIHIWLSALALFAVFATQAAQARDTPKDDLDRSLIRAAGKGDQRSFNLVQGLGANLHAKDAHGNNAVLAAVEGDQPAMLRILLDQRVSPNTRGESGFTPLTYASLHGATDAVRLLLKAGAAVDAKNATGDTPLHLAIAFQRTEIMADLLAARPRLDLQNAAGETALYTAVRTNNDIAVRRLLALGADPSTQDRSRRSALMAAILEDREAIALALVEAGARLDQTLGTYTPLRMARIKGQQTLAALLVDKGARE